MPSILNVTWLLCWVKVIDDYVLLRYAPPMTKNPKPPHPVRYWRFMNGERLLETATKLGISESYLSLLERNKRGVSQKLAMKIEKKLGIPRNEIRPDLAE